MKNRAPRMVLLTVCLSIFLPVLIYGQNAAQLQRKLDRLNAYPDLIVFNGQIATVDGNETLVQAMAIKNRRILALGTNDEIRFLAGPRTEMLDVKGRTVLPGLSEVHDHVHTFAELHWLADGALVQKFGPEAQLTFAKSNTLDGMKRAVEAEIKRRANEMGPGKWILVGMWSTSPAVGPQYGWVSEPGKHLYKTRELARALLGRGLIDVQWLDQVAPDNPVLLRAAGQVPLSIYNTPGSDIVKERLGSGAVRSDGRSSSSIQEYWLYDILLKGKVKDVAYVLKLEMDTCLAPYGVTSLRTRMASPAVLGGLNWLDRQGDLPVRWAYVNSVGYNSFVEEEVITYYKKTPDFRGHGSESLWNVGVGSESDPFRCTQAGNPRDPNAKPEDLYTVPCEASPSNVDYASSERWREAQALLELGLRLDQMHGQTDGTYDGMFEMIEQAVREGKLTREEIRETRIGLEHNAITRPDQVAKLANYGFSITFQPFHYFRDTLKFVRDYGEQFLAWGMPAKTFAEAGVRFTVNTAYHLTKARPEMIGQPAPANFQENSIWPHYAFYITREQDGQSYLPEQAISREELLRAVTRRPAEVMFREKEIGSLEVGKLADFLVIDKDYFAIPDNQIDTITTLMTVKGGETTYRSSNF